MQGWGGVLRDLHIGGHWKFEESLNHINYLEILAVFLSLKAFANLFRGKHVLVKIDNMTAVADIERMGTSRSRKRNLLVCDIWTCVWKMISG